MSDRAVSERAGSRFWVAACGVAALAVVLWSWAPAAGAPYQYDDYRTPVKDPASQSLAAWARSVPHTLRPLTKLTFALESSAGLIEAPARRALHFVLFSLACVLVALLAHGSGLGPLPSTALAAAWGAHPVHAETLVSLAGRSVLLSLTLCLASALCVLKERARLALLCAVLAVLARETAWAWLVACAFLVAHRRPMRTRVALATSALVVGAVLALASSRMRELLAYSYADPFALDRLGLQWAAVPAGLWRLGFAPSSFSVDMELVARGGVRFVLVLAAAVMFGLAAWLALSRTRALSVRIAAWLWLALVLPTHSVVPKLDALTARDVSASSSALAWIAACVLVAGAPTITRHLALRVTGWGVVCALLVLLTPMTRARAELARDPVSLWRDACARSVERVRPCLNLGTLMAQREQLNEARAALQEAQRRDPTSSEVRVRIEAVDTLIETRKLLTRPDAHEKVPEDDSVPR